MLTDIFRSTGLWRAEVSGNFIVVHMARGQNVAMRDEAWRTTCAKLELGLGMEPGECLANEKTTPRM